jgi:hypothetical protein
MTNSTNRKREGAAQWKARKKELQSYAGSQEEEWSAVTECRGRREEGRIRLREKVSDAVNQLERTEQEETTMKYKGGRN